MKTVFRASFLTDAKKLRDAKALRAVADAIVNVEQADSIQEIRAVKRLSGHRNYFRIRIGEWRIGLMIEGAVVYSHSKKTILSQGRVCCQWSVPLMRRNDRQHASSSW